MIPGCGSNRLRRKMRNANSNNNNTNRQRAAATNRFCDSHSSVDKMYGKALCKDKLNLSEYEHLSRFQKVGVLRLDNSVANSGRIASGHRHDEPLIALTPKERVSAGDSIPLWLVAQVNVGHPMCTRVIAPNEQFVFAKIVERNDSITGGRQDGAARVVGSAVIRANLQPRSVGRSECQDFAPKDGDIRKFLVVAQDTRSPRQLVVAWRQAGFLYKYLYQLGQQLFHRHIIRQFQVFGP